MIHILIRKEEWKALNNCRANRDGNQVLTMLHVTKNYVETTNGSILLRVERENYISFPSDAPVGVYSVISVTPGMFCDLIAEHMPEMQYPDTNRVIPSLEVTPGTLMLNLESDKKDRDIILTRAVLYLYSLTNTAYSIGLLLHLIPLNERWDVCKTTPDGAIALTVKNKYTAVVLPFKFII